VRKVCQACGMKLAVVRKAATEPTQSMRFMVFFSEGCLVALVATRESRAL
jgi:hypothetical protein